MKKIILLFSFVFLLTGCSLYGTTKVGNTLDISQSDFSHMQDLKKGASCSFLILGFIPWPWVTNKTPGTLLGAIEQAQIHQVEFIETTYEYHFLYAQHCKNVYGY